MGLQHIQDPEVLFCEAQELLMDDVLYISIGIIIGLLMILEAAILSFLIASIVTAFVMWLIFQIDEEFEWWQ